MVDLNDMLEKAAVKNQPYHLRPQPALFQLLAAANKSAQEAVPVRKAYTYVDLTHKDVLPLWMGSEAVGSHTPRPGEFDWDPQRRHSVTGSVGEGLQGRPGEAQVLPQHGTVECCVAPLRHCGGSNGADDVAHGAVTCKPDEKAGGRRAHLRHWLCFGFRLRRTPQEVDCDKGGVGRPVPRPHDGLQRGREAGPPTVLLVLDFQKTMLSCATSIAVLLAHHSLAFLLLGATTCRSLSGLCQSQILSSGPMSHSSMTALVRLALSRFRTNCQQAGFPCQMLLEGFWADTHLPLHSPSSLTFEQLWVSMDCCTSLHAVTVVGDRAVFLRLCRS